MGGVVISPCACLDGWSKHPDNVSNLDRYCRMA
jgi:hypothetical protein